MAVRKMVREMRALETPYQDAIREVQVHYIVEVRRSGAPALWRGKQSALAIECSQERRLGRSSRGPRPRELGCVGPYGHQRHAK